MFLAELHPLTAMVSGCAEIFPQGSRITGAWAKQVHCTWPRQAASEVRPWSLVLCAQVSARCLLNAVGVSQPFRPGIALGSDWEPGGEAGAQVCLY